VYPAVFSGTDADIEICTSLASAKPMGGAGRRDAAAVGVSTLRLMLESEAFFPRFLRP